MGTTSGSDTTRRTEERSNGRDGCRVGGKDCHAPKIRSKKVAEVPIVVFYPENELLAQFKKSPIITFSAKAPPRSGRV